MKGIVLFLVALLCAVQATELSERIGERLGLGVRFESEEHRSICRDAANAVDLAGLATKLKGTLPPIGQITTSAGSGNGGTPPKLTAKLGELSCKDQEDWTGEDDFRLEVFADGSKVDTINRKMKKGRTVTLTNSYDFTRDLRLVATEADWADPNDDLGSATVNIPGSQRVSFTKGAHYDLELVVTSSATTGGQKPGLVTFSSSKGDVAVGYDDICALSGDFLVGSDPKKSVIGVNPDKNYAQRPESEMQQVFTASFNEWYPKLTSSGDAGFKVMIARLKGMMDKEVNAIGRHRNKNIAIAFAYSEDSSPFGGKTINFVTNSHNNNYAKVMLGEEPDINYHWFDKSMAAASNNLSKSPYLQNAIWNLDHFVDSFSKDVWVAAHKVALETAVAASKASTPAEKATLFTKALVQNAAGDHFACDRFAAGHQRDPRREMLATPQPDCNMERTGLAAQMMHDEDNAVGLNVKNARGATWRAYGDKWLFSKNNEANYKNAVDFVKASITELATAFFTGAVPTDLKSSTSAYSLLPDLDTSAQTHPPLFRRKSNKWEYRTSRFDQPATYTTDWNCDLFNPMSDTSSTNSRFEDNIATSNVVKERIRKLQETYFAQMDVNKDGRVLVDEFVAWLQFVVPEVKQTDVTGRIVIQKFFAKFPVIDKGALTVQDFDYLLAIRSDQSIGLLTIEQFARLELLTLLKEAQSTSPRFAQTLPSSRRSGITSAVSAAANSAANAAAGAINAAANAVAPPASSESGGALLDAAESLGGVVWSRIRRIVDAASPDSANIKGWDNKAAMDKMKLHAATLIKRQMLPNNASFHQYRWLIDEELRRAERKYIMLQSSEVSLTPMEKKSWAAICLWASMDPKMNSTEKKNLDHMTSGISAATKDKFKLYLKDAKFAGGRSGAVAGSAPTESLNPPSAQPKSGAARGKAFPSEPPRNVADELSRLASFVDDKNNKDMSEAARSIVSTTAAIGAAVANVASTIASAARLGGQ